MKMFGYLKKAAQAVAQIDENENPNHLPTLAENRQSKRTLPQQDKSHTDVDIDEESPPYKIAQLCRYANHGGLMMTIEDKTFMLNWLMKCQNQSEWFKTLCLVMEHVFTYQFNSTQIVCEQEFPELNEGDSQTIDNDTKGVCHWWQVICQIYAETDPMVTFVQRMNQPNHIEAGLMWIILKLSGGQMAQQLTELVQMDSFTDYYKSQESYFKIDKTDPKNQDFDDLVMICSEAEHKTTPSWQKYQKYLMDADNTQSNCKITDSDEIQTSEQGYGIVRYCTHGSSVSLLASETLSQSSQIKDIQIVQKLSQSLPENIYKKQVQGRNTETNNYQVARIIKTEESCYYTNPIWIDTIANDSFKKSSKKFDLLKRQLTPAKRVVELFRNSYCGSQSVNDSRFNNIGWSVSSYKRFHTPVKSKSSKSCSVSQISDQNFEQKLIEEVKQIPKEQPLDEEQDESDEKKQTKKIKDQSCSSSSYYSDTSVNDKNYMDEINKPLLSNEHDLYLDATIQKHLPLETNRQTQMTNSEKVYQEFFKNKLEICRQHRYPKILHNLEENSLSYCHSCCKNKVGQRSKLASLLTPEHKTKEYCFYCEERVCSEECLIRIKPVVVPKLVNRNQDYNRYPVCHKAYQHLQKYNYVQLPVKTLTGLKHGHGLQFIRLKEETRQVYDLIDQTWQGFEDLLERNGYGSCKHLLVPIDDDPAPSVWIKLEELPELQTGELTQTLLNLKTLLHNYLQEQSQTNKTQKQLLSKIVCDVCQSESTFYEYQVLEHEFGLAKRCPHCKCIAHTACLQNGQHQCVIVKMS